MQTKIIKLFDSKGSFTSQSVDNDGPSVPCAGTDGSSAAIDSHCVSSFAYCFVIFFVLSSSNVPLVKIEIMLLMLVEVEYKRLKHLLLCN